MFNKSLLVVALAVTPIAFSQDASAQCCGSPVGYAAYSVPTAVAYAAPVAPVVYTAPVVSYRPYYAPAAYAPAPYGVAYRGYYGYRPAYGYRPRYGYGYGYRSYYRPYGGVRVSVGF